MSDYDILFVDDDPNILKAIKRILHGQFNVCTADTVEEALKLVENITFPVIISDMEMPSMTGADFLIIVKQLQPESIRILLTGEIALDDAIKAINESEIFKVLTKPCPPELLKSTLESALRLHHTNSIEHHIMDKTVKGIIYILVDLFNLISPSIFQRNRDIVKCLRKIISKNNNFKAWDLEISCILMFIGSVYCKIEFYDQLMKKDNLVKVLNKTSQLLLKVPKFENVSSLLKELSASYENEDIIWEIDSESKLLKLLIDFEYNKNNLDPDFSILSHYSHDIIDEYSQLFNAEKKKVHMYHGLRHKS